MKSKTTTRKYGKKLIISSKELSEYSIGRNGMFVIENENFEKISNPVKPDRFVNVAGNISMKMN